jgi:predicted signal transduction protein with EAL and GGDEF domain
MTCLTMVAGGKTIPVTVSVGVAAAGPAELGVTALIERADDALYRAKRAGRDRCTVAGGAAASVAPEPEATGFASNALPPVVVSV